MIEKLEKLQIRGFGANEKLDIDFSPQVTSIVGKSFIGKSWMLRALRWVLLNKPAGDAFINWDSDEAKVRLSIDSKKVIRIRSKSLNTYKFSGKKEPYAAFGNDVPKDIAELVNVSDINFQGQHAAPFWFCETAGEVSRQLNSIVNLKVIDSTLAEIDSQKRKTRIVIEVVEESLTKVISEKKGLAYVEDLNRDLIGIEGLWGIYEENTQKRRTIGEKIDLVQLYASERENRLGLASDGVKTMSAGSQWGEIADSVGKLSNLVKSCQSLNDILKNKPPSFTQVRKLKEKMELIISQFDGLDNLIEAIENRSKQKCQIEKDLEKLKKELIGIAGGRCPLCGASMKT